MKLRQKFLRRDFLQEIFGEQADVLGALAERRELDADDVQPVEKVLAEVFRSDDLLFEVLVRRGDDAHVGLQDVVAADAGEFALLQHAQDLALQRQRHVADFVEEKRAAIALLEAPDARAGGAGEGALFVAEELALEQLLGDGRAVDGDEALRAALAVVMDGAGDQFLARAALAGDHDRRVAVRDAADHLEDLLHGRRFADDASPDAPRR